MGIGTSGLGSFLEGGGGGGGITVIPDGGELNGDYTGSVYCEGSATVTGSVYIKGDLYTQLNDVNVIYNLDGNLFEVLGDTLVQTLIFSPLTAIQRTLAENPMQIQTYLPHGYSEGDLVVLEGTGSANADGCWQISEILSDTQFNIAYDNSGSTTSFSGTALCNRQGGTKYTVDHIVAGTNPAEVVLTTTPTLGVGDLVFLAGNDGGLPVNHIWSVTNVVGNTIFIPYDNSGGPQLDGGVMQYAPVNSLPDVYFDGDLVAGAVNFSQLGGYMAYFNVKGDMTLHGTFYGSGWYDTNGAGIYVGGTLTTSDYIYLNGGEGIGVFAPDTGNGGNLEVHGNAKVAINAVGGSAYQNLVDAGNGGSINVYGHLEAANDLTLEGGVSQGGYGGDGGYIEVASLNSSNDILVYGGPSYTVDFGGQMVGKPGGHGGDINVYGDLTGSASLDVSGNDSNGALDNSASDNPPHSGSVYVEGSATFSYLNANGGAIRNTLNAPCRQAGNGGDSIFYGNVACSTFSLNGGNVEESVVANAGRGGNLTVTGITNIQDHGASHIFANGGTAPLGSGGNGGYIASYGGGGLSYVAAYGGNGGDGHGGLGGYLQYDNIDAGDNVSCGRLDVTSIDLHGGDCTSTNKDYYAGSGGGIWTKFPLSVDTDIQTYGGERSNVGSFAGGGAGANGGPIYCFSDLHVGNINAYGGSVVLSGGFQQAPGGYGGIVHVEGSLVSDGNIANYGGDSDENNGGQGGTLECWGPATMREWDNHGGNTTGVSICGSASFDSYFANGLNVGAVNMLDGTGGLPATSQVALWLGGSCNIWILDVADRGLDTLVSWYGLYIALGGSGIPNAAPCLLTADFMPTNNTLIGFDVGGLVYVPYIVGDGSGLWRSYTTLAGVFWLTYAPVP